MYFSPKKILRKNLKKLENFEKNFEIFFYDKSRNAFFGFPEAIWCSYYVPYLNLKTVEYPLNATCYVETLFKKFDLEFTWKNMLSLNLKK